MTINTRYKKSLSEAVFILSKKLPTEDIKVKQRLERAYDIVRSLGSGYAITPRVNPATGDTFYQIYKESTSLLEDNSVYYTVDSQGCTCPDAISARAGLCKHRIATMLLEEMQSERA
jgi:hypothetical protein